MVTLVGGGISPEACGHNPLKYLSLVQPSPCSSFGLCSIFQKSGTCENLQKVLRQWCLGCCVCLRGHRKREVEGEGPSRERGSRARKMEDTASTHRQPSRLFCCPNWFGLPCCLGVRGVQEHKEAFVVTHPGSLTWEASSRLPTTELYSNLNFCFLLPS